MFSKNFLEKKHDILSFFRNKIRELENLQVVNQVVLILCALLLFPFFSASIKSYIFYSFTRLKEKIMNLFSTSSVSVIDIKSNDYRFTMRNVDKENDLIQRALEIYISEKQLSLFSSSCSLISIPRPFAGKFDDENGDNDDSSTENLMYEDTYSLRRSQKWLRKRKIVYRPLENNFYLENGIYLQCIGPDYGYTNTTTVTTTFKLTTKHKNGVNHITAFLEKCLRKYMNHYSDESEKQRYMYCLQVPKSFGFEEESKDIQPYKSYRLQDEKLFDSLFFPQKEYVKRIVDNFLENKGKFGLAGFPYKLGFLLYGSQGCGKTSFVKALSSYTKRHIIHIPLHFVTSNQQLYDILYECAFSCQRKTSLKKYSFSDLIFVLEDNGSLGSILQNRKEKSSANSPLPCIPDSTSTTLLDKSDTQKSKTTEENTKESENTSSMADNDPTVASSISVKNVNHVDNDESDDSYSSSADNNLNFDAWLQGIKISQSSEQPANRMLKSKKKGKMLKTEVKGFYDQFIQKHDPLNLAGLLNILDGVIDTPGRIVVLTTKHPEVLDPALLRPGRLGIHIKMDYMRPFEILEMVAWYYFKGDRTQIPSDLEGKLYDLWDSGVSQNLENQQDTSKNSTKISLLSSPLGGHQNFSSPIYPSTTKNLQITGAEIELLLAENDSCVSMLESLIKNIEDGVVDSCF